MLKIGFVDHHLNNFHANKFLELLHGPLAGLDARVVAAWESDPVGDDWCAAKGIPRAESAEAVAAACDAVMVLAPDNIEAHVGLCRRVFPAGKPVLVDKFLAPGPGEARQIMHLAAERGVHVFSASSLRFAGELRAALDPQARPTEAFARGQGLWEHYGVHTLSLVLGALGPGVGRVIDTGTPTSACVTLEYRDGRRGWVEVRSAANQGRAFPWSFGFRVGDSYTTGTVTDANGFYTNLMREAVSFFRSGASPVSAAEMLEVCGILEAAVRSRARGGVWIDL